MLFTSLCTMGMVQWSRAFIISAVMTSFPGAFLYLRSLMAFSTYESIISLPSSFVTSGGFPQVSLYSVVTYSSHIFLISFSSNRIFPFLSLLQLHPFCLRPFPMTSFIFPCISLVLCCDWRVTTSSHFVCHHSSLALQQSISISFLSLLYFA